MPSVVRHRPEHSRPGDYIQFINVDFGVPDGDRLWTAFATCTVRSLVCKITDRGSNIAFYLEIVTLHTGALTGQVANAVSSTSPSITQRSRRLDLDHKQ